MFVWISHFARQKLGFSKGRALCILFHYVFIMHPIDAEQSLSYNRHLMNTCWVNEQQCVKKELKNVGPKWDNVCGVKKYKRWR